MYPDRNVLAVYQWPLRQTRCPDRQSSKSPGSSLSAPPSCRTDLLQSRGIQPISQWAAYCRFQEHALAVPFAHMQLDTEVTSGRNALRRPLV